MLFPTLSQEQAQIRSDSYSCSSARYFVTAGTLFEIETYCARKQQAGETVNVHNLCQLVAMHENNKKSDIITETKYLPEQATRLDQNIVAASNVDHLSIQQARLRHSRDTRRHSNGNNGYKIETTLENLVLSNHSPGLLRQVLVAPSRNETSDLLK